MLSGGRIVLDGELRKSLKFPSSMEESVQHIEMLDIAFRYDIVDQWPHLQYSVQKDWKDLSEYIAGKLKIDELNLTIVAGQVYEDWEEKSCREKDILYALGIHAEIIDILVAALQGRKPKAPYIFRAAFHDQESTEEKKTIGDEYNTAILGKIPPEKRIFDFPHGPPDDSNGWRCGMDLS